MKACPVHHTPPLPPESGGDTNRPSQSCELPDDWLNGFVVIRPRHREQFAVGACVEREPASDETFVNIDREVVKRTQGRHSSELTSRKCTAEIRFSRECN